jgi:hypothetical protein
MKSCDQRWTSLVNNHRAVEKYLHPKGNYCVYVVKRDDGNYCTYEEELSGTHDERTWHPIGLSSSIFGTKEEVLADMRISNAWIMNVKPEYKT